MKNKTKFILIIFIFSIAIMLLDVKNGYLKGHDTDFHLASITAIADQLSWDNLTVQEPLKYMANDLGYGTRFFYPPIPHLMAAYITKLLTIFNIDNVAIGMRITQWLTIFLSGVTFYFLGNKIFKSKKVSMVLSIFYMTAPYHLAEIFVRDAFSEMFIPIAIPLIILGLLYLTENNYKQFLLCFVGGYTLAIYSHLAMTIYFTLIILVTFFTVYFKQIFTKKNILYLIWASVLILLLTASFWLPMLEIKLTGSYGVFMPYFMTGKGDLRFSTISIAELFMFDNEIDYTYIRFNVQIFVTIMFALSIYLTIKNKLYKEKIWKFLFAFTILSAIMVTSLFPWYYTPNILQTLQFPWRLALYATFGIIIIAGISLKRIEKTKYFNTLCCILIFLTLITAYINIDHSTSEPIDLNDLNNQKSVGNQAEYLPEKALKNMEYYKSRTKDIIIEEGNGKINKTLDEVPNLTFEVVLDGEIKIELPRIYYQGYKLEINGEEVELQESENGFLEAVIKKSGTYKLTYEKTTIMKIANILSLITFLAILVILIRRKKLRKQIPKLKSTN